MKRVSCMLILATGLLVSALAQASEIKQTPTRMEVVDTTTVSVGVFSLVVDLNTVVGDLEVTPTLSEVKRTYTPLNVPVYGNHKPTSLTIINYTDSGGFKALKPDRVKLS